MAEVVGRTAAEALLRFYGDAPFTVPLYHAALKLLRNREILEQFARLT